jgi:hypothetical protein
MKWHQRWSYHLCNNLKIILVFERRDVYSGNTPTRALRPASPCPNFVTEIAELGSNTGQWNFSLRHRLFTEWSSNYSGYSMYLIDNRSKNNDRKTADKHSEISRSFSTENIISPPVTWADWYFQISMWKDKSSAPAQYYFYK